MKKHQVPIKEVLSCLQFLQKVHVVHDSISKAFQSRHLSIQWLARRFVQFAAADAACSIENAAARLSPSHHIDEACCEFVNPSDPMMKHTSW